MGLVALIVVTFSGLLGPFDLLTFLHAGRTVVSGASPYSASTSSLFRSGHAFVYPIFVAWLFAPLALLSTGLATVIYLVGSVAAVVASCWLLGTGGLRPSALILTASTTIVGLQMGTLNAALLLGVALCWHWRDRHPVWCGVLLGVVATAKLFLMPLLAWPALARRYRSCAGAAASAVALLVAGALFGPLGPLGYVRLLADLGGREQVSSWSLASLIGSLGVRPSVADAMVVGAVGSVLVLVWNLRDSPRHLRDDQLLGLTVACSLLLSPIVWSSYLLLISVPLLLNTSGNAPLAAWALASWLMVTPDAASPRRVAVGLIGTVVVGALAAGPEIKAILDRLTRRGSRRVLILSFLAATGSLVVLVCLPARIRSPVPAVLSVVVAGFASWRSPKAKLKPKEGLSGRAARRDPPVAGPGYPVAAGIEARERLTQSSS